MKLFFALMVAFVVAAPIGFAEELAHFTGRVTAVDVNQNNQMRCFTAVDEQGQVKIFKISSLKHLDVNDRVIVTYQISDKFPLIVTRIRFLQPE